jgi:hypothetical protein
LRVEPFDFQSTSGVYPSSEMPPIPHFVVPVILFQTDHTKVGDLNPMIGIIPY